MKKIILPCILFLGLLTMNAQSSSKTESEIAEIQTEKMSTILTLNDDQKSLVYTLNIDAALLNSELKKQKLDENEYWEKRKEIEENKRKEVSNILTTKQKSLYFEANSRYDKKTNTK